MSVFISLAVALYYGWKLTMVVISYVPIALITNSIIEKVSESHFNRSINQTYHALTFVPLLSIPIQAQVSLLIKEQSAYSTAANVAEEVFGGIRTVFAFGGERIEIDRYNNRLMSAKQPVQMKSLLLGIREGILRFLFFGSSALAYWYGVQLVLEDRHKVDRNYTPSVMMIVCATNE